MYGPYGAGLPIFQAKTIDHTYTYTTNFIYTFVLVRVLVGRCKEGKWADQNRLGKHRDAAHVFVLVCCTFICNLRGRLGIINEFVVENSEPRALFKVITTDENVAKQADSESYFVSVTHMNSKQWWNLAIDTFIIFYFVFLFLTSPLIRYSLSSVHFAKILLSEWKRSRLL